MTMIHKDNIEEWLFEYHEGLLDVVQKKNLLNFLVENPEYHDDFVLWESARLPLEKIPVPEEVSKSLLKSGSSFSALIYPSIIGFGAGICIALLGVYLFQPNFLMMAPKQESPSILKVVNYSPAKQKSNEAPFINIQKPQQSHPTQKSISLHKNSTKVAEKNLISDSSFQIVPKALPEDQHLSDTPDSATNFILKPILGVLKDSITLRENLQKQPSPQKKPKNKLPFSLKPAQDFETGSPNF